MKLKELIPNNYYKIIPGWIIYFTGIEGDNRVKVRNCISLNSFYKVDVWGTDKDNEYSLCTDKEIYWLEECERKNKFIKFEDLIFNNQYQIFN